MAGIFIDDAGGTLRTAYEALAAHRGRCRHGANAIFATAPGCFELDRGAVPKAQLAGTVHWGWEASICSINVVPETRHTDDEHRP